MPSQHGVEERSCLRVSVAEPSAAGQASREDGAAVAGTEDQNGIVGAEGGEGGRGGGCRNAPPPHEHLERELLPGFLGSSRSGGTPPCVLRQPGGGTEELSRENQWHRSHGQVILQAGSPGTGAPEDVLCDGRV